MSTIQEPQGSHGVQEWNTRNQGAEGMEAAMTREWAHADERLARREAAPQNEAMGSAHPHGRPREDDGRLHGRPCEDDGRPHGRPGERAAAAATQPLAPPRSSSLPPGASSGVGPQQPRQGHGGRHPHSQPHSPVTDKGEVFDGFGGYSTAQGPGTTASRHPVKVSEM